MKANYDCAGNKIFLADEMMQPDQEYDQAIYFQTGGVGDGAVDVRIFNRDGSEAGNCLNGMRALSDLLHTQAGIKGKIRFLLNGIVLAESWEDETSKGVTVDFPKYQPGEVGKPDRVVLGNEHLVHWRVKESVSLPHDYIPRINEEFILDRKEKDIFAIVYEKGVGETASCGSGAVAIGYSAFQRYGQCESYIHYPGGELQVQIGDSKIYLSGRTKRL